MSTAIIHPGTIYEFGDLIMKNQTTTTRTQINALVNNSIGSSNSGNLSPIILHQNLNAAQQQQHQQQTKIMLHNALTRASSHPSGTVDTLMNSLNEILRASGGHRKLERTQSEPLPQVNTSRYKTELCRPFEEAGECKYGDKCQFAHGMQELRNLQRHPKYKTELCRTFHSVGFCPYGPRCHFVHNAEEARNHNRNVAAYHARLQLAQKQQQQQQNIHLPLSPALSMSTGSDRASPISSLTLSPTTSMANFFPEQNSPTFAAQVFNFPVSPPASPNSRRAFSDHCKSQCSENALDINMSPVQTPPPKFVSFCENFDQTDKQCDDARLPVFNRLSSTVDAFTNLAI